MNLSKSGIGFSVGTKGARLTSKTGGGTRTTLSVPGTGISYVSDSRKGRASASKPKASDDYDEDSEIYAILKQVEDNAAKSAADGRSVQYQPSQRTKKKRKHPVAVGFLTFFLICSAGFGMMVSAAYNRQKTAELEAAQTASAETAAVKAVAVTAVTVPKIVETPVETVQIVTETTAAVRDYVVNTSSKKFHRPGCASVSKISQGNRQDVSSTYAEMISRYQPCQKCNPY